MAGNVQLSRKIFMLAVGSANSLVKDRQKVRCAQSAFLASILVDIAADWLAQ
jgi:hypothetical protein